MRLLGITWGVGGVLLLLLFALWRLTPMALELRTESLSALHGLLLLGNILYMAYAEGYKGFYQGFAPRIVVRARYLGHNPQLLRVLFAPAFCMGFFHATRKRKIVAYGLTLMILCFITIARLLPQPWRGIVDAGVVVGLSIGVASIVYFAIVENLHPGSLTTSADVPANT